MVNLRPNEAKRSNRVVGNSAAMASSNKQDPNPSLLAVWNALKCIAYNTNSLMKDLKDLQNSCNELQKSLEFSQAKIAELTTSNSDLQTKVKSLEKRNWDIKK